MPGMQDGDGAGPRRRPWSAAVAGGLLLLGAAVAACGGGGGGPPPRPAPPPQPGPAQSLWPTRAVNLDAAIGNLAREGIGAAPGAGVTIGFVDLGMDAAHPALDPGRITLRFMEGVDPATASTDAGDGHATSVVGVAAAVPGATVPGYEDRPIRGVAWGAEIEVLDRQQARYSIGDVGDYVRALTADRRPDIVSISFGWPTVVEGHSEEYIRRRNRALIEEMEQAGSTEKTVFVFAAGNDGRPDPNENAGMVALIPEIQGHTVAAVSTREDGAIADSSNRCGIAAEWCIAAPADGAWVATTEDGVPKVVRSAGTSLAAPMVSGGLAVMKQAFRGQLSNTELVTRLFRTANKGGVYAGPLLDGEGGRRGPSPVYGQGLMDLGAATAPVGDRSFAGGATVGGPGIPLGATGVRAGAAFGDGISRALARREVAVFDGLGAPFWLPLDSLAAPPPAPVARAGGAGPAHPAPSNGPVDGLAMASGWVHGSAAYGAEGARLRFGVVPSSAGAGHAALAGGAVALAFDGGGDAAAAAFTTTGIPGRRPVSGASLSWLPQGGPLGVRAGWIGESGTLLGTGTEGAFGPVSGDSMFAGLSAGFGLPDGWRLGADAEMGVVSARPGGGLLRSVSQLTTSALSVSGVRALSGGGDVTLRVSQPLRVETGEARLAIPVGRTPAGEVLRSSFTAGLGPSGRQVDISAEWRRPLPGAGRLSLGLTWTRHPRHDSTRSPEMRALAGFTAGF